MTLDEIRDKIRSKRYIISQHAFIESAKDEVEDADIESVIFNGKIIETYPEDTRGASLLISGDTAAGTPLHVVVGVAQEEPVIITVYLPGPPKWTSPTERDGSRT